tara:strand:- start:179 stop:2494 length:2316 start_codon:yes stop_codon:yes gene_type:complete
MAPPTERQMKIADLRNKGLTQGEIAKQLGIARSTVARDWALVKAERSELPLGYEEPVIVSPINMPNLSTSIQVELNCLEFEKMRDSKVIYAREAKGGTNREIFEPRSNNIVHSVYLNQVPVKRYIELSKIAFKHNIDALRMMDETFSLFFEVTKTLQIPQYPNLERTAVFGPDRKVRRSAKNELLRGYIVDFKQTTSFSEMYDEEQQQMIFEKTTEVWISEMKEHLEETEQLFNKNLSWSLNHKSDKKYDLDSEELFAILSINFEVICEKPQLLTDIRAQFREHELSNPVRYQFDRFINLLTKFALLENGINENDIYIAIEHKIADASFLQAFINSGAKTLESYQNLDSRGFSSIYDEEEFDDLEESFSGIGTRAREKRYENLMTWTFAPQRDGALLEFLRRWNWDNRKLSIASKIFEITGKKVEFSGGHAVIESLSEFEWPSSDREVETLVQLVQKVGLHNLYSWIYPEYNPLFIQYAIESNRRLSYEHAKPTFKELMNREYVFPRHNPQRHRKYDEDGFDQMSDSFLMKYGLGWAKSNLEPRPYAVLEIIRNSHGKQIPLLNLMREVTDALGADYRYSSEVQIRKEIEEHLRDICVILPNDIVQILGRKRGPMGNVKAIEKFKVEENKTLAAVEKLSQSSIKPTVVAKFLGAHVNELESFFRRLEDEEIHAVRLARVIRDEDLPQGCHLVWRYFVHLVNERRPKLQNEEDTFVHDIDLAKELLELNSSQVNTLHQVRMIRNDIDHPSDGKVPKPTWKLICGVLKICELF